ncbi:hypothetical protein [Mucilaginibacter sp.]
MANKIELKEPKINIKKYLQASTLELAGICILFKVKFIAIFGFNKPF